MQRFRGGLVFKALRGRVAEAPAHLVLCGLGFGVWGVGCGVWGVGCEVSGFGLRDYDLGFRV